MGRLNVYFPEDKLLKLDSLAKDSKMNRSEYLQHLVSNVSIHTSDVHTSELKTIKTPKEAIAALPTMKSTCEHGAMPGLCKHGC